ncbi:MAG TPA: type II toxin-antitoxin system VapB family antitoxin [Verrucomicrobiales bacterium]|jgi:metal-responsive CopG/Arc/MetJ family transcriptional regulator|nr:type II toxin-antitoxin system VapB family antitoxin [Verrucomicrobiales bacterium]
MRITIEIEEAVLEEVEKITGEKKRSPAVAKIVEDFVKRTRAKEFGRRLREGAFDYPMTNEEVEGLDR